MSDYSDSELPTALQDGLQGLRESLPKPDPKPSEQKFLTAAAKLAEGQGKRPSPWKWRLAMPVFSVVFGLLLGFIFLATSQGRYAQEIIPGHGLYSLKRLSEAIVFHLPQSLDQQSSYQALLEARRRDEVVMLRYYALEADFAFSGVVEQLEADTVRVSGILCPLVCAHEPTHTISDASVVGTLEVGAHVTVEGRTLADGSMHITQITVQR